MANTYVVIGSNSFSGGWMVDTIMRYEPNSRIIGISRSQEKDALFLPYKTRSSSLFQFYRMDINREYEKMTALLDQVQPDFVINFAAQGEVATSWKYPAHWFETNAVGVVKLAHFLNGKSYLKRYVHISTPEVYGACQNATEQTAFNPSTPYAASKASGDLFLATLAKQYQFPLITIRSTNVYGKHQQLYRIIPRAIIFLKKGSKISLHGGGHAVKSYVHIQDVCEGIYAAMLQGRLGEVYHFSPDQGVSVRDLVQEVCTLMGYNFQRSVEESEERPGQDSQYIIDSSKARRELQWYPKILLRNGLLEVIDWINGNYERILSESLEYVHIPS